MNNQANKFHLLRTDPKTNALVTRDRYWIAFITSTVSSCQYIRPYLPTTNRTTQQTRLQISPPSTLFPSKVVLRQYFYYNPTRYENTLRKRNEVKSIRFPCHKLILYQNIISSYRFVTVVEPNTIS
mmetsp:Transcript_19320/g.40445  ORF Transcript_19320/g.40445 Transcript_19320/m.40445 type:complete len:126 (-) Transcript_19320:944-1321(-)